MEDMSRKEEKKREEMKRKRKEQKREKGSHIRYAHERADGDDKGGFRLSHTGSGM